MRCPSVLLSISMALAAAATAVPTQAAPDDDRPQVKTVNRSYGGKVVQNSWEQRLRIRFRGAKGDLVALRSYPDVMDPTCETAVLRRLDSGRKVVQLHADLWRLPASARYVVSYRHECFLNDANDAGPEDLSIRTGIFVSKVVTHELVPGGPAIHLPLDRRALHAAVLTLSDTRAVQVTSESGGFERHVVASSLVPEAGPGDAFDTWSCPLWAPVVVQAGWGIAHHAPRIGGGTELTEVSCRGEGGHVPSVGESVWFLSPRRGTVATAAYVE